MALVEDGKQSTFETRLARWTPLRTKPTVALRPLKPCCRVAKD